MHLALTDAATRDSTANDQYQIAAMTTLLAPNTPLAASRPVTSTSEREAARFCLTFTGVLLTILASVALVNFAVNPFAQYATQLLPPIVQMSRVDKLALFDQLPVAPDALVVGSSRVLKIEPNYVQSLTGLSCFNAGVNYAVPIDHLAWFRHHRAKFGKAPKLLIVGLDLSSFSPSVATDARLISNPQLAPLVRDHLTWSQGSARWTELLAWQQTRESLRSIKHCLGRESSPECIESYRPDGLLIYHQREQQIAEGTYNFVGALDFNKSEYLSRYRDFDQLSADRLSQFGTLVKECAEHHTELIAFLTPLHPDLLEHLQHRTEIDARRNELVELLQRQSLAGRFDFVDLTEIDSYSADAKLFVDGIHQLEPNTRKLLQRLLRNQAMGAINAL